MRQRKSGWKERREEQIKAEATDRPGRTEDGGAGAALGRGAQEPREAFLVELRVPPRGAAALAAGQLPSLGVEGIELDPGFTPVPMEPPGARGLSAGAESDEELILVRATLPASQLEALKAQPNVLRVVRDSQLEPFSATATARRSAERYDALEAQLRAASQLPCDCTHAVSHGALPDVARYLGVERIWEQGWRGAGIVIGIVDGGIAAHGRPVREGERAALRRVIGGWPEDSWGTTARGWSEHGNMTATDALGMAPEAEIYDIRISDGSFISSAIAGFQWAITRHRADGTPHILSCSFGIYNQDWDADYASDPEHPLTRKVVQAIDEGIIVLFAAGNCGDRCPDRRCDQDVGPGRSIWGANGHPRVLTIGAVNLDEQVAGYSSQGPAALAAEKPDVCAITHFRGYGASDSGTSAATPIAAGVVALLKQAFPALDQELAGEALRSTAKSLAGVAWDPQTGAGVIQAWQAYELLASRPGARWQRLEGVCLYGLAASAAGPARLDLFTVGSDGALYHRRREGAAWSSWSRLGGSCVSAPAALAGEQQLEVFVIGGDRGIQQRAWGPQGWTGWQRLGGSCQHGVAAVASGPRQVEIFTVGADNALYHRTRGANGWGGWRRLGGALRSAPVAAVTSPTRIDLFAIGIEGDIMRRAREGDTWLEWQTMEGPCALALGAISLRAGQLDLLAISADGEIYERGWDGKRWTAWQKLAGSALGTPACVPAAEGNKEVFLVGADSAIYANVLAPAQPRR